LTVVRSMRNVALVTCLPEMPMLIGAPIPLALT
jgi:hypothetical protein